MAKDKTKEQQTSEPQIAQEAISKEETWKIRQEQKVQKIIDGKRFSMAVVARTEEARQLAAIIESIDEAFQDLRNNFGSPRGATYEEFGLVAQAFRAQIGNMKKVVRLLRKQKYKEAAQLLNNATVTQETALEIPDVQVANSTTANKQKEAGTKTQAG